MKAPTGWAFLVFACERGVRVFFLCFAWDLWEKSLPRFVLYVEAEIWMQTDFFPLRSGSST